MNEPPLDLSPLDPDADRSSGAQRRVDRVVTAAMRRIGGERQPRRSWTRLAAMLLLGAALGWFGRGLGGPERITITPAMLNGEVDAVTLAGVFDELDISDAQRATIRTVIDEGDPASDELLMAVARELHDIISARDASIRQVLLPDQRNVYEERVGDGAIIGFRRDYLMERAHVRIEAYLR